MIIIEAKGSGIDYTFEADMTIEAFEHCLEQVNRGTKYIVFDGWGKLTAINTELLSTITATVD